MKNKMKKSKKNERGYFDFHFCFCHFHFISSLVFFYFHFCFCFHFRFCFSFIFRFFLVLFLNLTMAPLGHHTGWNTRGVFVGFIVDFCLSLLLNISLQFNISRIWLVFYTPFDAHYLILLPSFFREYTLTGLTEVPTDNLRTECNLVTSM